MVLSNIDIQNHVSNSQMITSFNYSSLKSSSYKIRIGKIIEPETGKIIKRSCRGYVLKPNEIVIIQSQESFKIPDDIAVSYTGLFSTSSKGLLLINASMIEPKYEGKLSCFIVNFSAEKKIVTEGDEIARLTFHKLTQTPSNNHAEIINDDEYLKRLRKDSFSYNKSFLDIGGIEKRIFSNTSKRISRQLTFGGFLIAFLLLFATLEPILSKWIWDKTGLVTTTEKHKLEVVAENAIKEKKEAEMKTSDYYLIQRLSHKVDSLENAIKKMNKKK
jgi:deoxycytidine triphosphate deaminase